MTQEEKQLLFIDLCARLPYGVIVYSKGEPHIQKLVGYIPDIIHYNIKPYLRPFSSMTEEEKEELKEEHKKDERLYIETIEKIVNGDEHARGTAVPHFAADWCNEHHFDYRGLIRKGLALKAPEGMYE